MEYYDLKKDKYFKKINNIMILILLIDYNHYHNRLKYTMYTYEILILKRLLLKINCNSMANNIDSILF